MLYQVYVIQNEEGRFYIGVSEDVLNRLEDHNNGVSKWTKHRGLWKLVWQSEVLSLGEARGLENELKRQKGGVGFYARTGLQRGGSSGS
ncbi:GIY-YIG nuclease family protein [Roseimicrobium gellanilyticum]|uniref:GIY-YIG nuclease family protein n=1 Tax=Roseimicrobium gellanilyticum TaxID=748857 RepID=UPI000DEA561B|nr:GIY-YIG nuclease family protein [Roseimicrobium gellanilyticum]